jgi:hypothetical protein
MVGLTYDEMMHGEIDYIVHRFNGWLMLHRFSEIESWKRSRMIAFSVAKSMGATKAKNVEDFMPINDGTKMKTNLTPEQIEKLKNL